MIPRLKQRFPCWSPHTCLCPDHPVRSVSRNWGLFAGGLYGAAAAQSTPNPAAGLGCPSQVCPKDQGVRRQCGHTGSIPASLCGSGLSSLRAPQAPSSPGIQEPPISMGARPQPWLLSLLTGVLWGSPQEHLSVSHNSLTTLHGELSGLPCLRVSAPPSCVPPASALVSPGTSQVPGTPQDHPWPHEGLSRQVAAVLPLRPLPRPSWLVQTV